jgi:hypothetical protein
VADKIPQQQQQRQQQRQHQENTRDTCSSSFPSKPTHSPVLQPVTQPDLHTKVYACELLQLVHTHRAMPRSSTSAPAPSAAASSIALSYILLHCLTCTPKQAPANCSISWYTLTVRCPDPASGPASAVLHTNMQRKQINPQAASNQKYIAHRAVQPAVQLCSTNSSTSPTVQYNREVQPCSTTVQYSQQYIAHRAMPKSSTSAPAPAALHTDSAAPMLSNSTYATYRSPCNAQIQHLSACSCSSCQQHGPVTVSDLPRA